MNELLGKKLFTVNMVLNYEQCCQLIKFGDNSGWNKSPPTGGGHGHNEKELPRTSNFCVFDDVDLAYSMEDMIHRFMPTNLVCFSDETNPYLHSESMGAEWEY